MTFPTIRLPFLTFNRPSPAAPKTVSNEAQSDQCRDDLRREYVEKLMIADACVGEYGIQALMGLYPKDF